MAKYFSCECSWLYSSTLLQQQNIQLIQWTSLIKVQYWIDSIAAFWCQANFGWIEVPRWIPKASLDEIELSWMRTEIVNMFDANDTVWSLTDSRKMTVKIIHSIYLSTSSEIHLFHTSIHPSEIHYTTNIIDWYTYGYIEFNHFFSNNERNSYRLDSLICWQCVALAVACMRGI